MSLLNTTNANGITGNVTFAAGATKFYQFGNVLGATPTPVTTEDYTVDTMVTERTVLKNLCARVDVAPGAGKTVIFTVYVNGVASALTCTISGASAITANDTADSVVLNPGDYYSMQIAPLAACSGTKAVFGVTQTV
jgi:hypothetical protein